MGALKGRSDLLRALPARLKTGIKGLMPTLSDKTDEQLMRLYLGGDALAFEEIYSRYAPRIYKYVQQRVREQAQTDELFQTIFLKFHSSRNRFKRGEPLGPWIFTLAKNATRDWARRKFVEEKGRELLDESEPVSHPGTGSEGVLSHPVLEGRERDILTKRFEQDMPFELIGSATGASASSVRQIAHRAISKLKRALKEEDEV